MELGFYAEYTLDEALNIIELKENYLNEQVNKYTEEITNIRSRIKLILHGISQLMEMD
jgi:prefoldin subunit 5